MGCRTTDFLLSQSLRSQNSPPFIGLAPLKSKFQDGALEKTRVFFGGSASRLPKLFHSFPYVAALCATQALSDAYGEADHGIYRHIEEVLARYITNAAAISSTRVPRLSRAIADACGQADLVRGPFVESLPDFEKGGLDSRAFGSRKGLRYVARCYPVTSAQKA